MLTAYLKALTQSLWAWGVTGTNERTDGARKNQTFDVLLVIELQVDVFDVCEPGRSNCQTQSTHLEHCKIATLSKCTVNPYSVKTAYFSQLYVT